jgi:hypothetical protein
MPKNGQQRSKYEESILNFERLMDDIRVCQCSNVYAKRAFLFYKSQQSFFKVLKIAKIAEKCDF